MLNERNSCITPFPYVLLPTIVASSKSFKAPATISEALAELAHQPVTDEVRKAYGGEDFSFGRDYIVPKPFDPRVIEYEAVAVARQACLDGVATRAIDDFDAYRLSLRKRMEKYWL